ncbi:hypothetical protein [Pseudogemmobacter sp. W21_MBD1_M6]|uniref:hypothetical protein n=1 Tax=Pseudogemmobacter sp. W21_MBD1_M6 TaxID=3240271 RepID=UPI003F9720A0
MKLIPCIAAVLAFSTMTATAEGNFGMAGLMSKGNTVTLAPLTLSVGTPLSDAPWVLKSGTHYKASIIADGSGELALEGSGFFRAIWVDELVVEDIEIRPFGVSSIEFDGAGTLDIRFIAIKPGQYELGVPGNGALQRLSITVE